jgi:hypothetical protein
MLGFLKLITADTNEYHLPAIMVDGGHVPSAGPLLLKLIIAQVHMDSSDCLTHPYMAH